MLTPVGSQQISFTASPLAVKSYPQNSRRAEQIIQSTANFIASSLQPVSVVAVDPFKWIAYQCTSK